MRPIGSIANEQDARRFGDYLFVRSIANDVEAEDGAWVIWVHDDNQVAAGSSELTAFLANPAAPQFREQAAKAAGLRSAQVKEEAKSRQRHVDVRTEVFAGAWHTPYITFILLGTCVLVSLLTLINSDPQQQAAVMRPLRISAYDVQSTRDISPAETMRARLEMGLPEILGRNVSTEGGAEKKITGGEVWRLITPIFIHFGLAHILFNFMALYQLGGLLEGKTGAGFMLAFVLLTAAASNLGQYLVSGPGFGGMSGVNYALFGYLWIRGRQDPGFGVRLDQTMVVMMIVWFVLCFTGLLGNIANTAHGVGLAAGAAWGWLAAIRAR